MTKPNPAFWSGKRVLLTGQTGFKGAWAAIWLHRMGAHVRGLALEPDDDPSLFELAGLADAIDHNLVDLRDRESVRAKLADQRIDIVIHMAAQALVKASILDPVGTFATNVLGTAHLLDALRDNPRLQSILVITSDKVYANSESGHSFVEDDPLGGKDPYSGSKAATEIVVSSFSCSFFNRLKIPVGTARGGNVIGGGDFSRDRVMADIVRASLADSATTLRHPDATRPWQHVLDCIAGYLVYAEHLSTDQTTPRAINFGPRADAPAMTVAELATRAINGLGGRPWKHEPDPDSIEARMLSVDTSLAESSLGFQSRLDTPTAVDWTIEWHRRHAEGARALSLCEEQISRYEELS